MVLRNGLPKSIKAGQLRRVPYSHSQQGFTLIEILIVVMIIGLIASLIAPNILNRFESSKEQLVKAQIELLSTSVQSFYLDVGRCPTDLKELLSSTDKHWRGPYLSKQVIPQDPWHRDYQYKCPGEHGRFDLLSLGPNGKMDDKIITNW
ncbi:MAG: type II secretion system major pseudopilin GspG [Nitrospirae bacterium]|nr:type II secretion system major pseudopilin GspG [Nitrospirota bacterium]